MCVGENSFPQRPDSVWERLLHAGPAAAQAQAADWDTALFRPGRSGMTSSQLDAGISSAARHCAAARYREASEAIPALITAAEERARVGGPYAATLLTRAYTLATAVAVKERGDLAWITADRAAQAARKSRHPLAVATAARAQFIVLRQHGHFHTARALADATVSDLQGDDLARPVVGHILLEAAYGAAQSGDATSATALWEHGQELARRGPAAPAWLDHAGPLTRDQVERYGLSVHHVLGETRTAMAHLQRIDARRMPTAERRARYRHDSAKLHRDLGDLPRALELLREQDAETPQDARRSSLRSMVAGMLRTSPALPGLRPYAEYIGAA
jgi:hypothetical protein